MYILQRENTRIHLQFNDWVERTATPREEVVSLRRDFLGATAEVNGDLNFSWPCLVFRAIKR